jgi:drug/metabolite transporter (DMT)-like permease
MTIKTDGMLLLVAAVWGTSYGLTKETVTLYPVIGFLAIRFVLTVALLSAPLIVELHKRPIGLLRAGFPTGLILACIFIAETFGLANTSATNAAVLISLFVVMTPFVEWVLLRRTPPHRIWLIVLLSVSGVFALSDGVDWHFGLGDSLIIGAALLRALMVTVTAKLSQRYNGTTAALTALQCLVVAIVCLILAITVVDRQSLVLPEDSRFWLNTLYLVLACTMLAFFIQNYAAQRVSPSRVSVLMGSEPLFGVMFAVYWLSEAVTFSGVIGMVLIVAASLMMIATNDRQSEQVTLRAVGT